MNYRRLERIKKEIKKAEEYLRAAEMLHKRGLYNPSVSSSHSSAFHSSAAAFLTAGAPKAEPFTDFLETVERFDKKLDPLLLKLKGKSGVPGNHPAHEYHEYNESESLLRVYHAKDFLMEVKNFLRRLLR